MRCAKSAAALQCGLVALISLALPACKGQTAEVAATAATAGCDGLELRILTVAEAPFWGGSYLFRPTQQMLEPGECFSAERAWVEDVDGDHVVLFEIAPVDHQRFREFNAAHLGRDVAMLVDDERVTVATISSLLPPAGMLQAATNRQWSRERAEAIAVALRPSGS